MLTKLASFNIMHSNLFFEGDRLFLLQIGSDHRSKAGVPIYLGYMYPWG